MNQHEGYEEVDTKTPFDKIDEIIAKLILAVGWIGVGMALVAGIILFGRSI